MHTHPLCRIALFIAALLPITLQGEMVQLGASYGNVVQALGDPDGELSAGSKKILTYGTAKVTLRDDKVTAVSPELERLLAERATKQNSVKAKRDANLVNYRGQWVTPEKKKQLTQAENRNRSLSSTNQSNSGVWLTNFNQAAALAKSQNRQLLLNFTGSDWCGWCTKLDREVFSTAEFMNYAREHYVLVKLDFPKGRQQTAALKRQNEALAIKYRVKGFPSIVVLKPSGSLHTTGGYVSGGPKAFLDSIR